MSGPVHPPLAAPRRSLEWALAQGDTLIVSVPRRDVRLILTWLDDHDARSDTCATLPRNGEEGEDA